ncbi:hypothetical protein [Nitrosospira multiformis]|uniref:hypothetical protein n=1 Tax=Nitrosospira multiformis TaxID=1231 RepID=UPI0015A72CC1|nr:hypothetical protein [Nitrosospira multiformis]
MRARLPVVLQCAVLLDLAFGGEVAAVVCPSFVNLVRLAVRVRIVKVDAPVAETELRDGTPEICYLVRDLLATSVNFVIELTLGNTDGDPGGGVHFKSPHWFGADGRGGGGGGH